MLIVFLDFFNRLALLFLVGLSLSIFRDQRFDLLNLERHSQFTGNFHGFDCHDLFEHVAGLILLVVLPPSVGPPVWPLALVHLEDTLSNVVLIERYAHSIVNSPNRLGSGLRSAQLLYFLR